MNDKIFIHGLESSSMGTKSRFFRELYPEMIIPDFSGGLPERMVKLNSILEGRDGIKLVGSSFGGLMAAIFAMEDESRVDRLVLLAPALNLLKSSGYRPRKIFAPVRIYHGTEDEVIPLNTVEKIAVKYFTHLSFFPVTDDHFLYKTFKTIDWPDLLGE